MQFTLQRSHRDLHLGIVKAIGQYAQPFAALLCALHLGKRNQKHPLYN
jgi:hypothetical protein